MFINIYMYTYTRVLSYSMISNNYNYYQILKGCKLFASFTWATENNRRYEITVVENMQMRVAIN